MLSQAVLDVRIVRSSGIEFKNRSKKYEKSRTLTDPSIIHGILIMVRRGGSFSK